MCASHPQPSFSRTFLDDTAHGPNGTLRRLVYSNFKEYYIFYHFVDGSNGNYRNQVQFPKQEPTTHIQTVTHRRVIQPKLRPTPPMETIDMTPSNDLADTYLELEKILNFDQGPQTPGKRSRLGLRISY